MSTTDRYRRQHGELGALTRELGHLLSAGAPHRDADRVRLQLSQLAGKLSIHLAIEDESLYPALVEHADNAVSSKARQFMMEMGHIKKKFTTFNQQWTAAAIAQDPDAFTAECQSLLKALHQRIQREDQELYPLADKALSVQ